MVLVLVTADSVDSIHGPPRQTHPLAHNTAARQFDRRLSTMHRANQQSENVAAESFLGTISMGTFVAKRRSSSQPAILLYVISVF